MSKLTGSQSTELQAALLELKQALEDARDAALDVVKVAEGIGGDVKRCIGGQTDRYMADKLQEMADDDDTTGFGTIGSLMDMLDKAEKGEPL